MRIRKRWVLGVALVALCVCGILLSVYTASIWWKPHALELFRTYVLDPIPQSVTRIKADQTKSAFGYRYVFRFAISRADVGLIIDSRPFRKVVRLRYRDKILSWDWETEERETGSGLGMPVYGLRQHVPAWFAPEEWPNPEAYAIYDRGEYGRSDIWVLLYNERIGEAYFIVDHSP